jgi:hypothetical protein
VDVILPATAWGEYEGVYSSRVRKGDTYMTYKWWIGACNELIFYNLDSI